MSPSERVAVGLAALFLSIALMFALPSRWAWCGLVAGLCSTIYVGVAVGWRGRW